MRLPAQSQHSEIVQKRGDESAIFELVGKHLTQAEVFAEVYAGCVGLSMNL